VVSKVSEILAIKNKHHKRLIRIFNLRKLNELEVRKKYQIKISKRNAVLVNLNDSVDIHRVWENIKQNIKTSAKESKSV